MPYAVEWSTESIMAETHYVTLPRHRSACRLLALPGDGVSADIFLSVLRNQGRLQRPRHGHPCSKKQRRWTVPNTRATTTWGAGPAPPVRAASAPVLALACHPCPVSALATESRHAGMSSEEKGKSSSRGLPMPHAPCPGGVPRGRDV